LRDPQIVSKRFKYPRTLHLPWSESITSDDKVLKSIDSFLGKHVIITTKMDGGNISMYYDHKLMYIVFGKQVQSQFRIDALLTQLQALLPNIATLQINHIYMIDGSNFDMDTFVEISSHDGLIAFYVLPRMGTITPWSTKATEIVNRCGFADVHRIERGRVVYLNRHLNDDELIKVKHLFYDRMTEEIHKESVPYIFDVPVVGRIKEIDLDDLPPGLSISGYELDYLKEQYQVIGRKLTDVELFMFAQVNSEHCRHKIFNASWTVDGITDSQSLFDKIKETYNEDSSIISAYSDNSAIIAGNKGNRFHPNPFTGIYTEYPEIIDILMKVETHNHPTGISPYPGAATGSGGEIRDEAATGIGGYPKAGITGFSVSNLRIPEFEQVWENYGNLSVLGKPSTMASALEIMTEAPIGAARFNNEFGRPALAGYFRTFEMEVNGIVYGYHKPIMIAGGMGSIKREHTLKPEMIFPRDDKANGAMYVIVIGGPAMLIGLGGATGSSANTGSNEASLDFASVQRANPEMQRRAQEVINTCCFLGENNPIISIHDIGAGGLSNGVPELANSVGKSAKIKLRQIPNADMGMSPMEIWCNEAQERYVLLVRDALQFTEICKRENCPFAIIGRVYDAQEPMLILEDDLLENTPIELPMSVLFSRLPKMKINVQRKERKSIPSYIVTEMAESVLNFGKSILKHPTVGSKSFLITIGDRTVTGLVNRDQMVGKWQIPVSNASITLSTYDSLSGEVMAVGERTPIATIDAPSSGLMAVGEAITNIASVFVGNITNIKLSANWMASTKDEEEKINLYDTVNIVSAFCKSLGITIPVGKDSLFMKTIWEDKEVRAPLSLIVSAFAPVNNVKKAVTPDLKEGKTVLILIDLGDGMNRLGGSIYQQINNQIGGIAPSITAHRLKIFFAAIQFLIDKNDILAYHDRSDGGLFTTLCEMCFAGRTGASIKLHKLKGKLADVLFNEELGAVIQVEENKAKTIMQHLQSLGLPSYIIGTPNNTGCFIIEKDEEVLGEGIKHLQHLWQSNSIHMQSLRDNPICAEQEKDKIYDNDIGLFADNFTVSIPTKKQKHKVAILREQGINGHIEMANAFHTAGFTAIDVHMNDILSGKITLQDFRGIAACGGFSYGDTLGAGTGWAKTILLNEKLKNEFSHFFNRTDTFGLGVCNGCQMLAQLQALIPGTEGWSGFVINESEQFEARMVMVQIRPTNSIFFSADMHTKRFPIVVAHGEGRVIEPSSSIVLQYVDNNGDVTQRYPYNPNGSVNGITGLTNTDGRFTIMMPHPERLIRTTQYSWHPKNWGEFGPWMKIFTNAYEWCCK
jgi:phosphoribosylformylglycinamidine synthase